MSNVIPLTLSSRRKSASPRGPDALIDSFAQFRRLPDDVFWLKENAELLNILECTGQKLSEQALQPHDVFYRNAQKRLAFFPQYYRFLLSICLDLEDLGQAGDTAAALIDAVAKQGLAESELSDLQRLEARRLMMRRGVDPFAGDGRLESRVRRFIGRPERFAVPDKKVAYELTHAVFYLSEYGRRDPQLSPQAATSLEFAGLLAYLDQNADLLAEICIAMRHAGLVPSDIWENWLQRETLRFQLPVGQQVNVADDYHTYLTGNWLLAARGAEAFRTGAGSGRMGFVRVKSYAGPLRDMSVCLYRLQGARRADWPTMQPHIEAALTEIGRDILCEARHSSDKFEAFFASFSRADDAR